MKTTKTIKVPTGEIYVAQGEKGLLEFLTVGDYGKDANIKADFLGITRELNGVPNGKHGKTEYTYTTTHRNSKYGTTTTTHRVESINSCSDPDCPCREKGESHD